MPQAEKLVRRMIVLSGRHQKSGRPARKDQRPVGQIAGHPG
ncbi:hypothetical protein AB395_00002969 [Sinorhizobium fredii CCBAU 45436]|nr:hypothetical protein SF83666_c28880 [Sinorhizobium fredii CCBAU 83666]AWI58613.1 hypothetical protein AB395_00002969 [Sinorhizobium fredii CCBAU 45436]AWM26339.1 hypothetical protein AOX55_00003098 [Sinorhizobium fredii CCBAU 25509]